MSCKMYRLCLFVVFICIASASGFCGFEKKKEEPKIHIIQVKTSSKQSDEPDVVELHFPPDSVSRRRRETKVNAPIMACKTNKDCPLNKACDDKLKICQLEKHFDDHKDTKINKQRIVMDKKKPAGTTKIKGHVK